VIAVNFTEKLILIGGTAYAGEMKKSCSAFSTTCCPPRASCRCTARPTSAPRRHRRLLRPFGHRQDDAFGRCQPTLIGDDEHGWSDTAVFNFEGGCYAKMIRLSAEAEPEIYATTKRFGTVLENVVIDPVTRELDLDDNQPGREQPRRLSDRLHPQRSEENLGPVPKNIIMLTADAFGVLPPIARLTPDQAMYHFLSGYTAKVAGTEIGVTEPEATFSTCFGAPFMPRHPSVYGNLLKERIAKGRRRLLAGQHRLDRRQYGVGKRMPIKATRALLNAALDGSLKKRRVPQGSELRLRRAGQRAGRRQPGATRTILDPRRPGPTRTSTTARRRSWSSCSSRTSRSSRFYSPERLFSVEARRNFVQPDIAAIP
jgi:phosphoenolpyruvate carboxykinase (ATP)